MTPSVLIVVHDWPPIRTAGTERVLKFAQHLPGFSFQPIVLTTGRYGGLSSERAQHVYRAGDWIHTLFSPLRWLSVDRVAQSDRFRVATVSQQSWLGQLRDRILIPDTKIGWLWPAVRLGHQLIERHRPALIFSSSPPETAHLVALRLSRAHRLPWVVDMRDGWTFEPPNPTLRARPMRRLIEQRMEAGVMACASAVVTTTSPIADDLRRRHPRAANRVTTIANGYDRNEFDGLARQRPRDDEFLLVHAGALASSREGTSASAFFEAVAMLAHRDPDTRLRVQFIGEVRPEERAAIQSRALTHLVRFLPPVSRREAHQYILDADALLLITAPGQRSVATLKLFDYIGAGVPIVALAEDNTAADIIHRYDLGITVAPNEPQAILRALDDMMARQQAGTTWPGFALAQQRFERRALTGQLTQVFNNAIRP